MEIRELGPGDEAHLTRLDFDDPPQAQLSPAAAARFLADERTHLWVAFDEGEPVGMLLAYELLRRRGEETMVEVYELGVASSHHRRGIGTALWRALEARFPGAEAYVLTEEANARARAFYASVGLAGTGEPVAMLDGHLNGPGVRGVP